MNALNIIFALILHFSKCCNKKEEVVPPKDCSQFPSKIKEDDLLSTLEQQWNLGDNFILFWNQSHWSNCPIIEDKFVKVWKKMEKIYESNSLMHAYTVDCYKYGNFCCKNDAENGTSTFYYRMGKLSEIYNGGPNETDIKDFLYKKLVQEKDFEIGCNGVLVPWDPPVRKPPC